VRQHRPVFYLDCKKLQKSSAKMAGILGELDLLFSQAKEMENPVVILDDLDALSPNLLGSSESNSSAKMHTANPTAVDQSKLIADRISHLFEASAHRNKISLISTCGTQDSINPLLSKVTHFPFIKVKIPALLEHEQMDLLKRMIQRSSSSSDVGELIIANKASGLLPRDLEKLTFRVARLWQSQLANNPINDVLTDALSVFTPLSQMQASSTSKGGGMVVWNDIGGLFKVKDKLESVIRHPILYRRIYERAQIRLPRGILLYGPPGCGKSIVIPALARECNYPIVKIRGPEIFDKYIGASEAKIRDIFERASQMAPSILFLDELEALAPRRGSDSTGVTDRVVNQLLTFLDGVEDASSGTVYIVGATSRPDKVVSCGTFCVCRM
jgi:peroxin-1